LGVVTCPRIQPAAGAAEQPVDVLVAVDDVEVAVAFVDQLELEGVGDTADAVGGNVVPGDGHDAARGVHVPEDPVGAIRVAAGAGPGGGTARVDVGPERRNDRAAAAVRDRRWRKGPARTGEGQVAVVVDVQ